MGANTEGRQGSIAERWVAPCKWCGKSFARKRIAVVFCSDECLRRNKQAVKLSHGESDSRLAKIWYGMRKRCKSHPRYAGRGIVVSSDWSCFEAFRDWSLSHGYQDHLVIDRINNDGNYEPSNCRWITIQENILNNQKRPKKRSVFRGVGIRTHNGRSIGSVTVHGKHLFGKSFVYELHAAMHYDRECLRVRGEHAKLNFPERKTIYLDEIARGEFATHSQPGRKRRIK